MNVLPTRLPDVMIVEPRVFGDERGFFLEVFHADRYAEAGIVGPFVQDNHARSAPGVLRGLHFQRSRPQGKLVRCVRGAVWDVAVDIRPASPTFGQWVGTDLTERNKRQIWIPPGFAHGYCVPDEESEVEYKCTDYYAPGDEGGIVWNDPQLAIAWPIDDPILSPKDAGFGTLAEIGDSFP